MSFFDALTETGNAIAENAESAGQFLFEIPENIVTTVGNAFSEIASAGSGTFTSETSRKIVEDSLSSSSVAGGIDSTVNAALEATKPSESFASAAGNFLTSDQGKMALAGAASGMWNERLRKKREKHEENLVKLARQHQGSYYVDVNTNRS